MAEHTTFQPPEQPLSEASNKPKRAFRPRNNSKKESIKAIDNKNEDARSLINKFRSEFFTKLIVGLVVLLIGFFTTVATGLWSYMNNAIDERVRSAVEREMSRQKESAILRTVLAAVKDDILSTKSDISDNLNRLFNNVLLGKMQTHVGALATGQFSLDKTRPVNTVSVFSPPENHATLYVKAVGLQNGDKISIISPNGKRFSIDGPGVFSLQLSEILSGAVDKETVLIQSVAREPSEKSAQKVKQVEGYFEHIYTMRFQIASRSGIASDSKVTDTRQFDIQYLLIITPTITLGSVK